MEQKKKILSDSVWSIAGLVLMNVTLQFAVYPFWERRAGEAALGNILYLISLMNVFAVSMGAAANYARIKKSAVSTTNNSPYLAILGVATVIAALFGVGISVFGGVELSVLETALFATVVCSTMWRYYADVEYKLSLNYKSYFVYYLFISVGYAIGIALFYATGLWPLTLLAGELFGLAYVFVRGKIFRVDQMPSHGEMSDTAKLVMVLLGSEMVSNLIFNADRILLKAVIGEVAVTEYYLASLLGKTVALLTAPLSGVIIGYLAKYKGDLTVKAMNITVAISAALVVLGTAACTVGSYIIIPILYPDQFEAVSSYFIMANLAQVMFFIASVIIMILLRFANSRYQVYVTSVYAVSFVAICIPFALKWGIYGFCIGYAVACLARLALTVILGYYTAFKTRKAKI